MNDPVKLEIYTTAPQITISDLDFKHYLCAPTVVI